jgi:hypothetical protein
MFVLVHHIIQDPEQFWTRSQEALPGTPDSLSLLHCLAGTEGNRATCLWEADSVEAVEAFLAPVHAGCATNEYRRAENSEGIAIPPQFQIVPPPGA